GLDSRFQILDRARQNPFVQGMILVLAGILMVLLVVIRARLQTLLTRVVFRRADREPAVVAIRNAGSGAHSEGEFLEHATRIVAEFVQACQYEIRPAGQWDEHQFSREPLLLTESND